MVRESFTETSFDFHFAIFYYFCLTILSAFFIIGCSLSQQPIKTLPQTEFPVSPQPKTFVRTFPHFAAVIAQPGDTVSSLAEKYLQDPSMDWFISEFNGITSLRPGQELIIPFRTDEKGGLTFAGYQTVPVISYHKFSRGGAEKMTVTEKAFEEQMRFLGQKGYKVISMDEFFDFLDLKRQIPKKSVVITIDDGWRSTYDIAFPILKKYGYPATLFVYTDLIIQSDKTLNWDIIREMLKSGIINVQCHTKTHRYLDRKVGQESFREYFEAIKKELDESERIIKKHLNTDIKYLAYPYGETNNLVIALLEKLGYEGAFTVERGSNPFFVDHYRINRSMIFGNFDLKDFEKNLAVFSDKELR
jgi:peptidoglycan/xylan/chitin deacetylase (PgdA/CDA1 family)